MKASERAEHQTVVCGTRVQNQRGDAKAKVEPTGADVRNTRPLILRIEYLVPLCDSVFDDPDLTTEELGEGLMEEYGGPVGLMVDTWDEWGRRYRVTLDDEPIAMGTCLPSEQQEKTMRPEDGLLSSELEADARAEAERLRVALEEAEPWVAKLAADAPEGMVGNGAIIQRSLRRIREALGG